MDVSSNGDDICEELEEMWKQPVSSLPVTSDLNRLASRIVVRVISDQGDGSGNLATAWTPREGVDGIFDCWFKCNIDATSSKNAHVWGRFEAEGWVKLQRVEGVVQVALFDALDGAQLMTTLAENVCAAEDSSRYFAMMPPVVSQYQGDLCFNCDDAKVAAASHCQDSDKSLCQLCDDVLHRHSSKRAHVRSPIERSCGVAFHSRVAAARFVQALASLETAKAEASSLSESIDADVVAEALVKQEHAKAIDQYCDVVLQICRQMERDSKVTVAVEQFLKKLLQGTQGTATTEMNLVSEQLIQVLGEDSATVRVLKVIHQSVVMRATYYLRTTILQDVFTTDYRGREGWIILVQFYPKSTRVTHIRREHGVSKDPSEDFWFEYQISFVFTDNASVMSNISLRISRLEFGAEASVEFKAKMNQIFAGGNLLLF